MADSDLVQNLCGLMFDHKLTDDTLQGYVREQDLDNLLDMHAALSMSSYSVRTSHTNEGGRLTWLPEGYPGRKLSITIKQCHFGPLYFHSGRKIENKRSIDGELKKPNSKKKDCTAKVILRKVQIFDQYKINLDDLPKQQCAIRALKKERLDKIKSSGSKCRVVYHVELPLLNAHCGHGFTDTEGQVNRVHHRIIEKAQQLAREGMTDVKQVQNIISHFVETNLKGKLPGSPQEGDRRYYPLERDLMGCMRRALSSMHFDHLDQDNLEELIHIWTRNNESNKFLLRKCPSLRQSALAGDADMECDNTKRNSFLFVHQNSKQKALLSEYGRCVLIDATYKTTRHSPPLFQLSVKTASGEYKVVGMMIIETGPEIAEHMMEALTILRSWNMDWSPVCILTHQCQEVFTAIEQSFSDLHTQFLLCGSECLQSWERWLKDHTPNDQTKKKLIHLLTGLIHSSPWQTEVSPEQRFDQALGRLQQDELWKTNAGLQDWFTSEWLSKKQLWSLLFLEANTPFPVNYDLSSEQDFLRSAFQKKLRGEELSALVQVLIETYLPSMLEDVVDTSSVQVVHSSSSDFLVPDDTVSHYVLGYDDQIVHDHGDVAIPSYVEALNNVGENEDGTGAGVISTAEIPGKPAECIVLETDGQIAPALVAPLGHQGELLQDVTVKHVAVSDLCQDISVMASQCNDPASLQLLIDNLTTSKDILLGSMSCPLTS